MDKKQEEEKPEEVVYFVYTGKGAPSDAPTEDITAAAWKDLPKHIQKSVWESTAYKPTTAAPQPEWKVRRKRKPVAVPEPEKAAVIVPDEPEKPVSKAEKAEPEKPVSKAKE